MIGVVVLAAFLSGCPAVYGPGGPAASASQPAATQASVGAEPDIDGPPVVTAQPARSPTLSEMATGAQAMMGRLARMLQRVERRHAEARAANDALRRDCVSEKLIQVRALMATAAASRARLESAVGANQLGVSQEAYTGIGIALLKTQLLAAEARQCMIDPPRIGHTETSVTVEPRGRGARSGAGPE
jgi:hypothetical protein